MLARRSSFNTYLLKKNIDSLFLQNVLQYMVGDFTKILDFCIELSQQNKDMQKY